MSYTTLGRTDRWMWVIERTIGQISMVFIFLMMLITVANVFFRYFFNAPIFGVVEIINLMMVIIGYSALVWCTTKGAHVKVEILSKMPSYITTFLDLTFCLMYLIISLFVSWQNLGKALNLRLAGQASPLLRIPIYPFYILIALAFGVLSLVLLVRFIKITASAVSVKSANRLV